MRAGIIKLPIPFDEPAGEAAASLFPEFDKATQGLITGAAGCSPYLAGLLGKEADWLRDVWSKSDTPDFKFSVQGHDISDISSKLRQGKRRAALYLGLKDLGGLMPVSDVIHHLSDFADFAVQTALSAVIADLLARKRLKYFDEAARAHSCGIFILAMGKHGAHELNYSSDIDLIALFDDRDLDEESYFKARKDAVLITQAMARLLSENTSEGYVFRTDLRLRPDPGTTPVCVGMEFAERYYESLGRTWERAAYIKARVIAGDLDAGQGFLNRLKPFVWRRYLDFAAIRETQGMLTSIRDHKGLTGPITFPGHNVKLGRGGIREIEFFAQTQQLIFGGREAVLQCSGTKPALAALAAYNQIDDDDAASLSADYDVLRMLEHRLQMLDDAQTHSLPAHDDAIARFSCFCGHVLAGDLEADVLQVLERVHRTTDFEAEPQEARVPDHTAPTQHIDADQKRAWENLPAFKSPRAQEIFAAIEPRMAASIAGTHDPSVTLRGIDGFISALPAGVQLFSLLEARPKLLDLLVEICGTTPDLAQYLARNARVFDAVLDAQFFAPLPQLKDYQSDLGDALPAQLDYEATLDALRVWKKEQHFQISVHLLQGISDSAAVARAFSDLSQAVLERLCQAVATYLTPQFGPPPGNGVAIIGMGKLGSREMTATSDLDLIVVYDAAPETETLGPRKTHAGGYYGKYTQRLIAALTSATAQGVLYEVDMRLRPSGRKGPIATSLAAFSAYQRNEAWTWEHLALARARVVCGQDGVIDAASDAIKSALEKPRDKAVLFGDVIEMRARLARDKPGNPSPWEIKSGAGRMLDIELFVQALALHVGADATQSVADLTTELGKNGILSPTDAAQLAEAYQLYATIQQGTRLAGEAVSPDEHKGLARLLERLIGQDDIAQIAKRVEDATAVARDIIDKQLNILGNMG